MRTKRQCWWENFPDADSLNSAQRADATIAELHQIGEELEKEKADLLHDLALIVDVCTSYDNQAAAASALVIARVALKKYSVPSNNGMKLTRGTSRD